MINSVAKICFMYHLILLIQVIVWFIKNIIKAKYKYDFYHLI